MTQLLLVCHQGVGHALNVAVCSIVEQAADDPVAKIHILEDHRDPSDQFLQCLRDEIGRLLELDQLLILTDLPGSTPHNLALQAAAQANVPVVSGLNLPMLLRCINHSNLSADELADKAVKGARLSIFRNNDDAA